MGLQDMFEGFLGGGASYESEAQREAAARDIAEKCGYAAAALTIFPIPLSEVLAVMPLHVGMVVAIGNVYGVDMTRDTAEKLILKIGGTVGLSLIGSRIATTAAKVILPGLGGLIGAPFMYASTIAIGTIARIYFANQGQLSDEQIKDLYRDSLKRAKQQFDPSRARDPKARQMAEAAAAEAKEGAPAAAPEPQEDPITRLERLKALLDKGLIEPEEFGEVKRRILDSM